MDEVETVESDWKHITLKLSGDQYLAFDDFRRSRGWTQTRLIEMALSQYFAANGTRWPLSEKRIA